MQWGIHFSFTPTHTHIYKCVCVCIYIYIYIYIYTHTHTHTYINTYTQAHTHLFTHTHIHIYTHVFNIYAEESVSKTLCQMRLVNLQPYTDSTVPTHNVHVVTSRGHVHQIASCTGRHQPAMISITDGQSASWRGPSEEIRSMRLKFTTGFRMERAMWNMGVGCLCRLLRAVVLLDNMWVKQMQICAF